MDSEARERAEPVRRKVAGKVRSACQACLRPHERQIVGQRDRSGETRGSCAQRSLAASADRLDQVQRQQGSDHEQVRQREDAGQA